MENVGISQGRINAIEYNTNKNISEGNVKENSKKITYSETIQEKDITEKEVKKSVEKLNKFLEDEKVHVEYEVHDKLNQLMIKIVDDETKEVIQEMPPKKILDMVAKMCEMVGILMDKKA